MTAPTPLPVARLEVQVGGAARPTLEERRARGREARRAVPRSTHAELPLDGRGDPVAILEAQNESRVPWLVPVRHGRMMVSPFTFYRGSAAIMASDLARTLCSGIVVQAGGDAHLSNFGGYASPERTLVFDQNDFDETLPGPWEWDLKRLAASVTVAAQDRGLDADGSRRATLAVVAAYREAMARFAAMPILDLWYDRLDSSLVGEVMGPMKADEARRVARFERKARAKTSMQALDKLAVEVDGKYQIRSSPPTLLRLRDVPGGQGEDLEMLAYAALEEYLDTLPDERRYLYRRFTPVDVGVKVVGVGSVGTRCLIVLLEGRDRADPLFLQVKEAVPSVLEPHLGVSEYVNHGRRVVEGQRLIQAASDIFLGWTAGQEGRSFYVRQLRDWKGSTDVDTMAPEVLVRYARLCGWTLARGHARSGDAVAISAYVGSGDRLDRSVAEFAAAAAAQNLQDHAAFLQAIIDGRIEAQIGV